MTNSSWWYTFGPVGFPKMENVRTVVVLDEV